MGRSKAGFEFYDPGELVDGELEVVLYHTMHGDPARKRLPSYTFGMLVDGKPVGGLTLRIGYTELISRYSGHIGYRVAPEHRGHHYAERSCRLLLPLFKAHGIDPVWITCNPDNIPSRRTCERLGAVLVEIVDVPEDNEHYKRGDTRMCRYRIDLNLC